MILSSYNGQTCWILPFAPNTDDPVKVDVSVPLDFQRAKAGLSSRRPQGNSLRIAMSWNCTMLAAEFVLLRNATIQAQDEPVAVPFWPMSYLAGDTQRIPSTLTIGWSRGPSGWTAQAINPSLAYDAYAPLLWGRLKQPPRLTGRNGNHVSAEISFFEDGPYPILPAAAADTMFATPGGPNAPVWPWLWEGSTDPHPGAAAVDTDRKTIGAGRQQSTVFYPQMPERVQQSTFIWKSSAAAAAVLGWWQRRAGGADAHWIPTSQIVGQLSADAAAGASQLDFTVAPSLPVRDGSLFLATPDGTAAYVKCSAPAGNLIPLAVPLAQGWPAAWTSVTVAILARHTDDKLSLEFRRADDDWIARATINWQEVAPEYAVPAGETLGTTIGRLSTPAYFFQVDLDYAGAIESWYFTDFEGGDITANGQVWAYNDCDFDRLVQSDDGSDDGFTFKADWIANGPWSNWIPGDDYLAAKGTLTIYRADVDAAGTVSNWTTFVISTLSKPTFDGPRVEQKALGMNEIFGLQGPSFCYMPPCRTSLFSARCTLSLAAWTFGATVVSIASNSIVLDAFTGVLPSGFGADQWFWLGYIQWTDGAKIRRARILSSTAIAGGQITIVTNRVVQLTAGATITIVPGCDHLRDSATGCAKFSNQANHQGFADIPAINPSFILPVRSNTSPAKK